MGNCRAEAVPLRTCTNDITGSCGNQLAACVSASLRWTLNMGTGEERTRMRDLQYLKGRTVWSALAAICLLALGTAQGQAFSFVDGDNIHGGPVASICEEPTAPSSLKDALAQVCLRK